METGNSTEVDLYLVYAFANQLRIGMNFKFMSINKIKLDYFAHLIIGGKQYTNQGYFRFIHQNFDQILRR